MTNEVDRFDLFWDNDYGAFQKWDYVPLIKVLPEAKSWVEYGESFYHAAEILIQGLNVGKGLPDVEGIAAVFLFRHYLELALKRIIVLGRNLIDRESSAHSTAVQQVARIHNVSSLWSLVLSDAKPKLPTDTWDRYDIPFVEGCIAEFSERDRKGFAFRYPRQGGERFEYDFGWIQLATEHMHDILTNMTKILIEQHGENEEWEEIQKYY